MSNDEDGFHAFFILVLLIALVVLFVAAKFKTVGTTRPAPATPGGRKTRLASRVDVEGACPSYSSDSAWLMMGQ